jgi:Zn-finger nucleic acid-binding protein
MKCPNCQSTEFDRKLLDDTLQAMVCTACHGHWINSFQYWLWRDRHQEILPEKAPSAALAALDSNTTKVCPECFKLLRRYKVGHGTDFSIDRCEVCRGIWFDKNEWEILRDRNLHDEVHFIFSSHWQQAVRQDDMEKNRRRVLGDRIGQSDLDRVNTFKEWLHVHPERSMILAYLHQQ